MCGKLLVYDSEPNVWHKMQFWISKAEIPQTQEHHDSFRQKEKTYLQFWAKVRNIFTASPANTWSE